MRVPNLAPSPSHGYSQLHSRPKQLARSAFFLCDCSPRPTRMRHSTTRSGPIIRFCATRFFELPSTAMSVFELPIQIAPRQVAGFCKSRGIRRLSLFGSILRDDFNPNQSDLDVIGRAPTRDLKSTGLGILCLRGGAFTNYWSSSGLLFQTQPTYHSIYWKRNASHL